MISCPAARDPDAGTASLLMSASHPLFRVVSLFVLNPIVLALVMALCSNWARQAGGCMGLWAAALSAAYAMPLQCPAALTLQCGHALPRPSIHPARLLAQYLLLGGVMCWYSGGGAIPLGGERQECCMGMWAASSPLVLVKHH